MRRGLYWHGAQTRLGMAPPPSSLFANEMIDGPVSDPRDGAQRSNWDFQLKCRAVTPSLSQFVHPVFQDPSASSAVRQATNAAMRTFRPGEVALLEVLREWNALVEISDDDALRKIANFIATGALRPEKLARAADTEPSRVRERLRWLFDELGRSELTKAIRPARRYASRIRLAA